MELIIGIFVIVVIDVVGTIIWIFNSKPQNENQSKSHITHQSKHSIPHVSITVNFVEGSDEEEEDKYDEDDYGDSISSTIATSSLLGSAFDDSKQRRIEAKKKRLAELEKEHYWERNYDPAWDTGSYTGNNWDSEEEKLDKQIGNLEQQNLSYGQWMDFEDRRTYRDECDPTEMPDEDEYGG